MDHIDFYHCRTWAFDQFLLFLNMHYKDIKPIPYSLHVKVGRDLSLNISIILDWKSQKSHHWYQLYYGKSFRIHIFWQIYWFIDDFSEKLSELTVGAMFTLAHQL